MRPKAIALLVVAVCSLVGSLTLNGGFIVEVPNGEGTHQGTTQSPEQFEWPSSRSVAPIPSQEAQVPPVPSSRLCRSEVTLVGNHGTGTYLCSYFPQARQVASGCVLRCSADLQCVIKNKATREELQTAEIIVNHHGPVPEKHRPWQTRVFYTGESNSSQPKKSTAQYWGSYDQVVSFHRTSRYYFTWTARFRAEYEAIEKGEYRWPPWEQRVDGIVVFISRCKKGGRDEFVRHLGRHYPVFSLGKCSRTHDPYALHKDCPASTKKSYVQKLCILSKYRFALALENSNEVDYVTEKVYHAQLAGGVALYDGAPNVADFLPTPGSVIHLNQFVQRNASHEELELGFKALAAFLRQVNTTSQSPEIRTLFSWRSEPQQWSAAFRQNLLHPEPTCELCRDAAVKRCRDPLDLLRNRSP